MPDKTTTALETPLHQQLDRLATFEPTELPVLSLYLDMQPHQDGRPAHGIVIFACHGANLFESFQLDVRIANHWLFIGSVPHLYPLARLNDQYPRYAALLVDTNAARLFVFSLGAAVSRQEVRNVKTRKGAVGGWAQARYQRHIENYHQQHIREVVDLLERVVRDESIHHIVVSCDEVTKPLLYDELPRHLVEKVVDLVRMDINTPEHEVLKATLGGLRANDLQTDAQHVRDLIGQWRAGGLAVVGPEATLEALEKGQVEELLITARPDALRRPTSLPANAPPGPVDMGTSAPAASIDPGLLKVADELVKRAQQSAARIRFVEDEKLLADIGGCGALLRYKGYGMGAKS